MIATMIFHDSIQNPKMLDHVSVDWMHSIAKLSTLDIADTRLLRNRLYRSRRVDIRKYFGEGKYDKTNLSIYLHGAGDSVSGCVRVYAWKSVLMPYNPNADINYKTYQRVGGEDFFDFIPMNFTENPGVAMFNLKVDDTWDSIQIMVSQPCTAISAYLNPNGVGYPEQFIKMNGAAPLLSDYENPIQDDFLGDNYDWETP